MGPLQVSFRVCFCFAPTAGLWGWMFRVVFVSPTHRALGWWLAQSCFSFRWGFSWLKTMVGMQTFCAVTDAPPVKGSVRALRERNIGFREWLMVSSPVPSLHWRVLGFNRLCSTGFEEGKPWKQSYMQVALCRFSRHFGRCGAATVSPLLNVATRISPSPSHSSGFLHMKVISSGQFGGTYSGMCLDLDPQNGFGFPFGVPLRQTKKGYQLK